MFIKTIKVRKPKIFAAILAAAGIICAVLLVIAACRLSSKNDIRELNSETKRQNFLTEMGWEVSDEYDECKVITIPDDFNEVYQNYNKLQKEQGFDLTKFKGKTAEVYTYKIKNYPKHENEEGIICNLIVCEDQLIGGDVCSTALDGFMQGLRKG